MSEVITMAEQTRLLIQVELLKERLKTANELAVSYRGEITHLRNEARYTNEILERCNRDLINAKINAK